MQEPDGVIEFAVINIQWRKAIGMAFILEVSCTGSSALSAEAADWFHAGPAHLWARLPGLFALDAYEMTAEGANDPFNREEIGPLRLVMLEFASFDALLSARSTIEQSLSRRPSGISATATAMERKFYPVGEQTEPEPLRAPFSYVVRYHRPAGDEAAFVANYVATHPQTLGRLPRIRSVICYFPIALPPGHFSAADYMIGNEVAFDTVADFNAAMQSPVRHELRAHFRDFPAFSGQNTHFPMTRTRLAG
jgi:hypothetical protein